MPGVVTVRSGVIIDREAFSPPILELLLLAEDIGLLNGTAQLLVTILDDNDNWPTFSPAALTVHLLENCPPGNKGQTSDHVPCTYQELWVGGRVPRGCRILFRGKRAGLPALEWKWSPDPCSLL